MAVIVNPPSNPNPSGGIGDIVTIDPPSINLDSMNSEITDMIDYTRRFVRIMMYGEDGNGGLINAIENLEAVVSTYNPDEITVDTTLPTLDGSAFPTKPTWLPLELEDDWPDNYIPEPNFQEYGEFDFEYVAPTPPSEVDGDFSWTEQDYSSDIWQTLFTYVQNYMLGNEDYSLPEDVYNALVAKEQEARRINQNREFNVGLAATGANGLNLPGGRQAAFISQFQNNIAKLDQDALNNITITDFNLSNENRKFFITAYTDLERIVREAFNQAQNRSLDAAKAVKEYLARFLSENIKLYLGKWEGIRLKFEANKLKIDSITARNNSETAIYVARADVLKSKIEAITAKNKGIVDARLGDISAYAAEVDAVRAEWLALIEEIKLHQENIRLELEKELRVGEYNLQAYVNKTQLAKDVALGIAGITSQGVASALGAINTTMSNSYSANEGVGANWSFGASLSEGTSNNHSYDHGEVE